MTQTVDVFPSLSGLLRKAMGPAIRSDAQDFLSMCAEDIVFEFPYAPEAAVSRLDGKAALAAYLPKVSELIDIESMELRATYKDAESETFVIEFKCFGSSRLNDARYDQNYISVVQLRDGLIAHYKDYWNPLVVLRATGSDGDLSRILKGETGHAG
ncbi:SnoaL-like domain-containing protein [Pelagibius litoralis]|uniref:SnoaL-like domain-containing protein n=1 Tax=Pelagibius litoralis TaxID=374515 RepID=A0A967EVK8_9PROT|nr:nuclear transport factor 2 family protein [Pelagibius litoralis]NIA68642.1 SnoaL-like domain-containing protein [Pelagibius litoralis]